MNPLQRTWWSRPSRAISVLALLLVAIGFGGYRVISKHGLNRAIEEIRAKGLPTNPKELDAWYKTLPAAENAGLKLLDASAVWVEPVKESDPGEVLSALQEAAHFGGRASCLISMPRNSSFGSQQIFFDNVSARFVFEKGEARRSIKHDGFNHRPCPPGDSQATL